MQHGGEVPVGGWLLPFALIYFTFFLDNVLLTVLVPIIPDWIRGDSLQQWTAHGEAPLAALLNSTVRDAAGAGASQAGVGAVLSAKAVAQLVAAGPSARAVCRLGAPAVLRRGTALLLLAALVFAACSGRSGAGAALAAGAGRAAQGAGAAAAGVAGLALASGRVPRVHRHRALAALLGAVALGVLVGYPFGGATYALWSRAAPFQVLAAALLIDLVLQYVLLNEEELGRGCERDPGSGGGWLVALRGARGGAGCAGACAGAVLLTTCVMAALEPCLPIYIMDKFHPQRWVTGAVFVPDSAAYLVSTSVVGSCARALGAERVALAGQVAVAGGALWLPLARSVPALAAPHALLGAGLGALDAALVPALLARAGRQGAPHVAALLQAAGAGAYALGPAAGGALAALAGFETTLRALCVLNLLYAAYLYRALATHPLSDQWGAPALDPEEGSEDDDSPVDGAAAHYSTFH